MTNETFRIYCCHNCEHMWNSYDQPVLQPCPHCGEGDIGPLDNKETERLEEFNQALRDYWRNYEGS